MISLSWHQDREQVTPLVHLVGSVCHCRSDANFDMLSVKKLFPTSCFVGLVSALDHVLSFGQNEL